MTHLTDIDQAPYSAQAPQTATVSDEAVQAALDKWHGLPLCTKDAMRTALTAALPHLALTAAPCSVEVKKLDWFTAKGHVCDKMIARDCFGNEFCRIDLNGKTEALISKIKTKAQEEYSSRLLSEIVTRPVDVAAVRRQAFEEAAALFERDPDDDRGVVDQLIQEAHRQKILALRALSAAEPVDQWQDIATAPKDGTYIDLWACRGTFYSDKKERYPNMWFAKSLNLWRNDKGDIRIKPEHVFFWMPLPAAPTSKGGE